MNRSLTSLLSSQLSTSIPHSRFSLFLGTRFVLVAFPLFLFLPTCPNISTPPRLHPHLYSTRQTLTLTEDSIIPPSNTTPRTRREAALAFIRPRSSRAPSTIEPAPQNEARWTDRLLGMVGLEIVWKETGDVDMERERERGRMV